MGALSRSTQRVVPTFRPAFHAHWERATAPEVLLLLAIVAAPLAIGGVHLVTRAALAGVSVVAFAWAAERLNRERRRVRVGLFGWAFAVALLVTFVQFLPLPAGLVEALSPAAYTARAEAARILGEATPSWMPLSLDQGRTAAAFVSLAAVTLAYLTATSLRSDSSTVHRLTIGVEVAALAVLGVGVLQSLAGVDRIFGVYEASVDTAAVPFLTTFVNPNHAAALMLLGALVAFGASLSEERDQRWHLPVGVALAIGVVATLSRANALLLLAGLLALTVPPLFSRRHRPVRARLVRLLIGASLCLAVAVMLIGPERWLAELGQLGGRDFAQQGLVRECWRVGLEVSWMGAPVGVGNGAFGVAASLHTLDWNAGRIAYAHMGFLQIVAELGWIAGPIVIALAATGFGLVAVRGRKDLPIWGAVVALAAVALQNGVDFSLWLHGVGIPAAVVLGLATQATWPDTARRESTPVFPGWRWPLAASAVLVGALVVTLPVAWREQPDVWREEARAALAAKAPQAVDRSALALAHGHDFVALELAAALADQAGRRDEARAWAERALVVAPREPSTLAVAVRLRLIDGDPAGAAELVERLDALGREGRTNALAIVLAARELPQADALMQRYFAADPGRVVAASERLAEGEDVEAARRLLAWALDRFPDEPRVFEAFGRWIRDDPARFSKLATECLARAGNTTEPARRRAWERIGYYFQGLIEVREGRMREAWVLLTSAAELGDDPAGGDRVMPLLAAGKVAERVGRLDWLDEALAGLARVELGGGWPIGEHHYLKSRRFELAGDLPRAIREMHEVLRHLGHVASFHDRLADLFYRTADAAAGDRARARARAIEAAAGAP